MKKMNKKGFTLAELLVVVAIIGVLVAIAIPVFGSALTNAQLAADLANVRAAYAEALVTEMATGSPNAEGKYEITISSSAATNGSTVTVDNSTHEVTVTKDTSEKTFNIDSEVVLTVNTPTTP